MPLVDLQGEKYAYCTLFVKIGWSVQENVVDRLTVGKLERKSRAMARLARMEEASRSGTSIESSASSVASMSFDEPVRTEGRDNTTNMELGKIREVCEK